MDRVQMLSNLRYFSSEKSGHYGRGILNTKTDPRKVERIGKYGEMVFEYLTGEKIDETYRYLGDKKDFTHHGKTYEIKTIPTLEKKKAYVLAVSEHGTIIQPHCDYYVVMSLAGELSDSAMVVIRGYVTREWLLTRPLVDGIGNWKNRVIELSDLRNIYEVLPPS